MNDFETVLEDINTLDQEVEAKFQALEMEQDLGDDILSVMESYREAIKTFKKCGVTADSIEKYDPTHEVAIAAGIAEEALDKLEQLSEFTLGDYRDKYISGMENRTLDAGSRFINWIVAIFKSLGVLIKQAGRVIYTALIKVGPRAKELISSGFHYDKTVAIWGIPAKDALMTLEHNVDMKHLVEEAEKFAPDIDVDYLVDVISKPTALNMLGWTYPNVYKAIYALAKGTLNKKLFYLDLAVVTMEKNYKNGLLSSGDSGIREARRDVRNVSKNVRKMIRLCSLSFRTCVRVLKVCEPNK